MTRLPRAVYSRIRRSLSAYAVRRRVPCRYFNSAWHVVSEVTGKFVFVFVYVREVGGGGSPLNRGQIYVRCLGPSTQTCIGAQCKPSHGLGHS